MAQLKYKGKLVWLPLERLRSASARSELTEMVMGEKSETTPSTQTTEVGHDHTT
jgi:hypothetical protein